jgi:hypothetical protein
MLVIDKSQVQSRSTEKPRKYKINKQSNNLKAYI